MTISAIEVKQAHAIGAEVSSDTLTVELDDGRTVSVPVAWYPRLSHATQEERAEWRIVGSGEGLHWASIDEDISVDGLLAGRPSGESRSSLSRWLEQRSGAV